MFKLSFSCNSAELLPLEDVCMQLWAYGYSGVELSFQRGQFDPQHITDDRIAELAAFFKTSPIKPVCISTATTKFLSEVPHEPSLINLDTIARAKRANLIVQGIQLAKAIGIPLVSFQSGYVRDEQSSYTKEQVRAILANEITQLLSHIQGDVRLVIEPEPGMFIETIEDAQVLIAEVNDNRFGLHLDIGHVFCSEPDYIQAIRDHGKDALYMHMADIKAGFNLKYLTCSLSEARELLSTPDAITQATLYDIDDHGVYLFLTPTCNYIVEPEGKAFATLLDLPDSNTIVIDDAFLAQHETQNLNLEILAYLDSVSGIAYDRALRAYHAVATLRLGNGQIEPLITDVVCNTLRGKVHYHDLFGQGAIDYSQVISAVIDSGFNGYCTVELYNHAPLWRTVAPSSAKFIAAAMSSHYGWDVNDFGHIDHTRVTAPYIRVADAQPGPQGDYSILYDFRLCQPNNSALPPATLHSLEHCLLAILPEVLPGFLMVAPMGCRTGLYITTAFPLNKPFVKQQIKEALQRLCNLTVVPYQSEKTCGMAEDHDLEAAKAVASEILTTRMFAPDYTVIAKTNEQEMAV